MLVYKKTPLDYLVISIWVIVILVFILIPAFENMFVRTVLALPMMLFIPGYMLVAALFPKGKELGAVFKSREHVRDRRVIDRPPGVPLDLLVVSIWVIATLVFNFTPVLEYTFVRTILAIPAVLFIPGYVLIAALFPKNSDLGYVERIALSVGTSIVVVPLLGLLLNFTTGIRLSPILVTLCMYTIAMVFIAAYRRGKLPADMQYTLSLGRVYWTDGGINNGINNPARRKDMVLTLILIFTVAIAAGMVYFVTSTAKAGERFTEFYILDPSGKAVNYPVNLTYNSPATFPVGVVNHEYSFVNYTVQVVLDKNILAYTRFMLNHNEAWENNITFVPDKEGKNMKLEFWLFKENNFTAPHRKLQLWVNGVK